MHDGGVASLRSVLISGRRKPATLIVGYDGEAAGQLAGLLEAEIFGGPLFRFRLRRIRSIQPSSVTQLRSEGVTCPVSCRHIGAINLHVELNVPRHGAETRRDR